MSERTRWVEMVGGPDNGLMGELPWAFDPEFKADGGIEMWESDIPQLSGAVRLGAQIGIYRPDGWKDRELGIARLIWRPSKGRRTAVGPSETGKG